MWLDIQRIHEIATVSRYHLARWVNITQYIYFIFKVDVLNYKYNDLYNYKTERSENRKWYSKLQQYSGKDHFMQMERGWYEPWDKLLLLFKCWQTLMEESKCTKNGRVHVWNWKYQICGKSRCKIGFSQWHSVLKILRKSH